MKRRRRVAPSASRASPVVRRPTPQRRALAIDEVARRCEFGTAQALRRAVRDTYGASPRQLRRAGQAVDDAPPPINPETLAWIDAM